jgi:hypothetical protein
MSQLNQLLEGDDEIGYDEIGAAAAPAPRARTRPARAPGATPTRGPTANLRKVFVGIPLTSMATLTSADITCPVLEPFRMDVPILSAAAQALHVANIRTGTKPLNVSPNPISGNAFSEQSINSLLSGYTAQPGTGITLSLYNSTGGTVVASGGFVGWAAL